MGCKHPETVGYMWRSHKYGDAWICRWEHAFTQPGKPDHHHRIDCLNCGESVPLGPAKDDGEFAEAVAIEVRAAELASDGNHWRRLVMDGIPGEDDEVDGYLMSFYIDERAPRNSSQHAGYLASCIVEHEEEL